jgi:hypothetical protein
MLKGRAGAAGVNIGPTPRTANSMPNKTFTSISMILNDNDGGHDFPPQRKSIRATNKRSKKDLFVLGMKNDFALLQQVLAGFTFGELAILGSGCRTASAITENEAAFLAVLSRRDYELTVAAAHRKIFKQNT